MIDFMVQYIDKSALVAEVKKRRSKNARNKLNLAASFEDNYLLSFLDTLEVKEAEETMSIAYVVTRCEEHSDYVEKVFFDEDKAQEYRDQFKGNENEYARHITRVEVTL